MRQIIRNSQHERTKNNQYADIILSLRFWLILMSPPLRWHQYKHRPEGGKNNYSESNQLRRIVGLRSVGVSIGGETADAHLPRCCVFHRFNAPFMRSLKLTTIYTRALRSKSNALVSFRRTERVSAKLLLGAKTKN